MSPIILRLNGIEASWIDALAWVGYTSLGFFSILFVILIAIDLFSLTKSVINLIFKKRNESEQKAEYDPERRGFLVSSMHFGIIGLSGSLSGYSLFDVRNTPDVVEVNVPFRNLHKDLESFRIVQLTDIHVGPTIKRPYVQGIVDRVRELKADLIVLTGDLADGSVSYLKKDVAPLSELSAPYGKFFVTGNHEYYSGVDQWMSEVDRLGFTILMNEHHYLNKKEGRIILAGVPDYRAEGYAADHISSPWKALSGADKEGLKILLAHQPRSIFASSDAGFDLQITGHTHGGQYLPWNFITARVHPYIKGLHKHKNTWIYVSRGTGYWGPPMRLGIPAEITVIKLTKI